MAAPAGHKECTIRVIPAASLAASFNRCSIPGAAVLQKAAAYIRLHRAKAAGHCEFGMDS